MSTKRTIVGLIALLTVGVALGFTAMSLVFVFVFSPFWWIGVTSGLTLMLISAIAALGAISK